MKGGTNHVVCYAFGNGYCWCVCYGDLTLHSFIKNRGSNKDSYLFFLFRENNTLCYGKEML